MKTKIQIIIFIFILVLTNCDTQKKVVTNYVNVAKIYNPSSCRFFPEYRIYHSNDSSSLMAIRLNINSLLFNQANPENELRAKLRLHYRLYAENETISLADSNTIFFNIIKVSENEQEFISYIPIKAKYPNYYSLHLVATDILRKDSHLSFQIVDKTTENTTQNFMILTEDRNSYFRNHFYSDEELIVRHRNANTENLYIDYYSEQFSTASPIFVNTIWKFPPIEPDTTFVFNYTDTLKWTLQQKGLYHLRVDTTQEKGLTIFNYGNNYPNVKQSIDMIEPLRYLTSTKEYEELVTAPNKKLALDKFWLDATGNTDRARELIRIYYQRVQFSNAYFSSYKEGWKTDRGMIYIIFGLPDKIYKKSGVERWIYNAGQDTNSISFTFDKKASPFSENCYVLKRNTIYSTAWRSAVDTWRNGRAYFAKF